MIDAAILPQLLSYDDQTGRFIWLARASHLAKSEDYARRWNSRYAGKPALTAISKGYLVGTILNRCVFSHRVAWAMVHGKWPDNFIDHINGNRADNRISNLREVDKKENGRNAKLFINNTSGCSGVHFSTKRNRWVSKISTNYGLYHIGEFRSFEEAVAARKLAEARFGYSHRHGASK